jgi:hypothetical protein
VEKNTPTAPLMAAMLMEGRGGGRGVPIARDLGDRGAGRGGNGSCGAPQGNGGTDNFVHPLPFNNFFVGIQTGRLAIEPICLDVSSTWFIWA